MQLSFTKPMLEQSRLSTSSFCSEYIILMEVCLHYVQVDIMMQKMASDYYMSKNV